MEVENTQNTGSTSGEDRLFGAGMQAGDGLTQPETSDLEDADERDDLTADSETQSSEAGYDDEADVMDEDEGSDEDEDEDEDDDDESVPFVDDDTLPQLELRQSRVGVCSKYKAPHSAEFFLASID